jgi:heat shock protein HtpX
VIPPVTSGRFRRDLFTQQEENRRKSSWLLIGFIGFFAWVGFGGDIALMLSTRDAEIGYQHRVPVMGIIVSLVAIGIAWSAWRYGDKQILWSTRAMELINAVTPEQQRLVNVVDEMSIASGLPRPTLWIVPDDDPNAFATGRDPKRASIAVTEGLLARLDRDELQAVVAHEFAHVARYDTRLMTLVAAMVGAIALLSDGLGRFLWHSGRVGDTAARSMGGVAARRSGGRGGGLGLILLVVWVLTLVIAPFVSRLMAMALSRKREFLADATAAQYTRNPAALASALAKLDDARGPTHRIGRAATHLCIVDPGDQRMQRLSGLFGNLLASHPPMAERIARLEAMGG